MKWGRRILIFLAIVVGLLLFVVIAIHTSFARNRIARYLESYASTTYNVNLKIGTLSYDLYPHISIRLDDVHIYGGKENRETFLAARSLTADLPHSALWSSNTVITTLLLDTPSVDMDRIPKIKLPKSKSKGTLEIQQILLRGGAVSYLGKRLEDIQIQAAVDPTAVLIHELKAKFSTAEITMSGKLFEFETSQYHLNYAIRGDAAVVSEFYAKAPRLTGPVEGSGEIQGATGRYLVSGDLTGHSLVAEGSGPITLEAKYRIDSKNEAAPYDLFVRWEGLPLFVFRKLAPDVPALASRSSGTLKYSGELEIWKAKGNLRTTLIRTAEKGLPVSGLVEAELSNGSLHLAPSHLKVRSADVNLRGTLSPSQMNTQIQAVVPSMADLAMFSPSLRNIPGTYRISAVLQGPYRNLLLDTRIQGQSGNSTIRAEGNYHFLTRAIDFAYSGDVDASLLNRYAMLGLDGRIQITGTATGTVSQPIIQASVQGQNIKTKDIDAGILQAMLQTRGDVLDVAARFPDLSLDVQGGYNLQNEAFRLSADIRDASIQQFRSYLPASYQQMSGTATLHLTAAGNAHNWKNSEATLTIDKADLARQDLRIQVQPGSKVELKHQVLTGDLNLKLPEGLLSVQGTASIGRRRELDLRAAGNTNLSLISLFMPEVQAKGKTTIDLNIRGTLNKPDVSGKIWAENFSLAYPKQQLVVDDGNLVAQMAGTEVTLQGAAQVNGGPIQVEGTVPLVPNRSIDLRVRGQNDLAQLSRITTQIQASGKAGFDVKISGTPSHPLFTGKLNAQDFYVNYPAKNLTLTKASVEAAFSGNDVSIKAEGVLNQQSPLKIDGQISLANQPGQIHLTLQSFPVATFSRDSRISGNVDLKVDASGTGINAAQWQGDLSLSTRDLKAENTVIQTSGPIFVHLERGVAELKYAKIQAGQLVDLNAAGQVNFNSGEINGRLQGSIEMALLSSFITGASAGGKLNTNLTISGSLTDPAFQGNIRIQNGALRLPQSPVIVERIQLSAPIQRDGITIETFQAVIGGGQVQGGGQISLKNWQPQNVDLWIKGQNIGMTYPEDLRSQLDADLKLQSKGVHYLLSGQIRVLRSIYEKDINYRDRLVNTLLSRKAELAGQSTFASRLNLDLDVQTIDDFRVKNNLGRLRASAGLQLRGSAVQPRLSGRVRIGEGSKLYFEGNEFEVNRGIIDFYGTRRIRPVFDVELFTIVVDVHNNQEYEITMPIRGPIDNLEEKNPTSVPDLAVPQIYYLLITGRADAQFSEAGSAFVQQQLVGYFTGQLFFDVQRKLASAFGLSRVEIQPELISSETNPDAKLVIGKDVTSQLSLIYSASLNNPEERTWIANYRLKRNLSVRFIDQLGGSYTTNLRHTVRFGPGVSANKFLSKGLRQQRMLRASDVQIVNHSPLPENEVRKGIDITVGDDFDFWEVQDEMTEVQERLQNMGYLFPKVEMQETRTNHSVDLQFTITDNGLRKMTFEGTDVTTAQIDKYKRWWREGFSEESVLELIREDLLQGLWFKGFHRAEVKRTTETAKDGTTYRFQIITGPSYPKADLVFQGASGYPPADLQKDLQNLYESKGHMISDALHNFDSISNKISALYVQNGYLDTQIKPGSTTYNSGVGVRKEFQITEGSPSRIVEVRISDNQEFPQDLVKRLKLWTGKIYAPQAAEEDEFTISDYYEQHGYRDVHLAGEFSRTNDRKGLILSYDLKTGGIARIEKIEITGNQKTRRSLIEKRIPFKAGDILTQDKLSQAQKNLSDLRLFHQVKVEAQPTDVKDRYDVVVDVVEMKHYELAYGIRYDTETNLGGEVQLQDLNLFGTGQSISFYTKIDSKNKLYRTVFHTPTIDSILPGLKWKTLLTASYSKEEIKPLEVNQFPFVEEIYLFSFQRQRKIFKPFTFLAGYQFKHVKESIIGIPESLQFAPIRISELLATVIADTRDDPFNAKRGALTSFEFTYAPKFLGSEAVFIKNYNQFFRFRPLGKMLWASGIRFGIANAFGDNLILSERFFAGGSYTLRGFRLDEVGPRDPTGDPLGGEAVIIINEELRFPVYKWVQGVVFYDVGNVYDKFEHFNPLKLRHSVGMGIRVDTPFGIGRFDLGINLAPRISVNPRFEEPRYVLHFGIGQAF
jgi:outer membrane protein assembly complex protein YaeT